MTALLVLVLDVFKNLKLSAPLRAKDNSLSFEKSKHCKPFTSWAILILER